MLEKKKIPLTLHVQVIRNQILFPTIWSIRNKYKLDGSRVISVVEGIGSYGREADKLEIMGLLTPEEAERDSVAGWLTADDVFRRIKEHYENELDKCKDRLPDTATDCLVVLYFKDGGENLWT